MKRIELDASKAEALAALQCTYEEIASGLGVSRSTLERRRGEDGAIDAAIKRGRELGTRSLRRIQWEVAKSGNVTMMIWLGKQWLGQKDKQEVEHTGKDGGPIEHSIITALRDRLTDRRREAEPASGSEEGQEPS